MDDEVDLWKGRLTAISELDQVDPPDWLDCGSNQRQKERHSFDRGRGPEPQIARKVPTLGKTLLLEPHTGYILTFHWEVCFPRSVLAGCK
jgi:hypothetical protein